MIWLGSASFASPSWDYWLLIRRSISDPTDKACAPRCDSAELGAAAGLCWTIKESSSRQKGRRGLTIAKGGPRMAGSLQELLRPIVHLRSGRRRTRGPVGTSRSDGSLSGDYALRCAYASSRQLSTTVIASARETDAPLSSPFSKSPSIQPNWFVTCARHTPGC
jgi:hypothetical protein